MTAVELSPALTPAEKPGLLLRLSRSWWALAVLALALLVIHIRALGVPPLAGTEGHRIVTGHQMLQSGHYLVPKMYGYNYLVKPPGVYWILAFAEFVGGPGTWTWRTPSVLSHLGVLAVCFYFGRRWFSAAGGAVAGLAFVLMVCVWQEARTADIDPHNTLAGAIATFAILELCLRRPVRRWAWTLIGGLALGAAFLLKLPAVLPAILVALTGVLAVGSEAAPETASGSNSARPRGPLATLFRPEVLGVFLLAGLVFLAWAVPLYFAIAGSRTVHDTAGLNEGVDRITPTGGKLLAALALPPSLLAFTLPASVAIVFALLKPIRNLRRAAGSPERLMFALASGTLLSWLICMLTGMGNPRYAYVTTPMVAVLAGGVFSRLYRERGGPKLAWLLVGTTTLGFMAGTGVLLAQIRRLKEYGPIPTDAWVASGLLWAIGLAALVILVGRGLRRVDRLEKGLVPPATLLPGILRGAVVVLVLAVLLSVPFAEFSNRRRVSRSGFAAARELAPLLAPNQPLWTASVLHIQPELFLYLDHPTTALGQRTILLSRTLEPGRTYLLDGPELSRLSPESLALITRRVEFVTNREKCYLVETGRPRD